MIPTTQTEDQILASAFTWAWNNYPQTRRALFHVPNELDRLPGETKQNHIRRLTQAKAKGVVPGIPDVILIWKGRAYAWEFKTPIGRVSPAQEDVHAAWQLQGIGVQVVRSVEEFQLQFTQIVL